VPLREGSTRIASITTRHPSNEYISILKSIFIVKLMHKDKNIEAANEYIILIFLRIWIRHLPHRDVAYHH
jgi:hypothetical protein